MIVLSQCLGCALQVELLEKKYAGGAMVARRAATVIQQAYRAHCMTRNFERLRCAADERRLSQRFAEFRYAPEVDLKFLMTRKRMRNGSQERSFRSGGDLHLHLTIVCRCRL